MQKQYPTLLRRCVLNYLLRVCSNIGGKLEHNVWCHFFVLL